MSDEIAPGTPIEAVLKIAGTEYSAATLRKAADGKTIFWDEERQALIYRGPMPKSKPPEFTMTVTGLPLAEAGLDRLRIRAPDGSLTRIEGLVIPKGSSIQETLEEFCRQRPGYTIVTAPSPEAARVLLELALGDWLEACNNNVPVISGITTLDYTADDLNVTITIKAHRINPRRTNRW